MMTSRLLRFGLVVLVAALVTTLFVPSGSAQAEPGDCRRGVLIEGRCISVDGQPPTCLEGAPCVEYVLDATERCPAGSQLEGDSCVIRTGLSYRLGCPDGSRGEPGDCYIYVATQADGCPDASPMDETGNCRKHVFPSQDPYCPEPSSYGGNDTCVTVLDPESPACPSGTARFDLACWRLDSATAPAQCTGPDAIELPSGQCREERPVPSGPSTCAAGSTYRLAPELVFVNLFGETHEEGEPRAVCAGNTTERGGWTASCIFTDDDYQWLDFGNGRCTRVTLPVVAICPVGYTVDDSVGGQCALSVPEVEGTCPEGTEPSFGDWCLEVVEWAEYECAAGLDPWRSVWCTETRAWQGRIGCGDGLVMLSIGGPADGHDCYPLLGSQPDVCAGIGGLEDCHVIVEPSLTACFFGGGCMALEEISIPGDVDCDGTVNIIDALLIAQFTAFTRSGSGSCAGIDLSSEMFDVDGDLNSDGFVDIIDALQAAQCDAGLPVAGGCGP